MTRQQVIIYKNNHKGNKYTASSSTTAAGSTASRKHHKSGANLLHSNTELRKKYKTSLDIFRPSCMEKIIDRSTWTKIKKRNLRPFLGPSRDDREDSTGVENSSPSIIMTETTTTSVSLKYAELPLPDFENLQLVHSNACYHGM